MNSLRGFHSSHVPTNSPFLDFNVRSAALFSKHPRKRKIYTNKNIIQINYGSPSSKLLDVKFWRTIMNDWEVFVCYYLWSTMCSNFQIIYQIKFSMCYHVYIHCRGWSAIGKKSWTANVVLARLESVPSWNESWYIGGFCCFEFFRIDVLTWRCLRSGQWFPHVALVLSKWRVHSEYRWNQPGNLNAIFVK